MAEHKKQTRSNKAIKAWFITFPQSGNTTLDSFVETFSVYEVQYSKVVRELHADGNPHLHLVIQFKGSHTKNALLGQVKKKFPDDWKRIHLQSLGSKHMADVYLGKDAQEVKESGVYMTKGKKERKRPDWIVEVVEREDEFTRFKNMTEQRLLEAQYEREHKVMTSWLIKVGLDEVYPVWKRRLEFTYLPMEQLVQKYRQKII